MSFPMRIRRTANAGVLLTLDDVSILLDGACQPLFPYLGSPPAVLEALEACPPDALAFTHAHPDHFAADFVSRFSRCTGRPVLGPEGMVQQLPGVPVMLGAVEVGGVKVTPVPSRHLGAEWRNYPHVSYLLEGSQRVFFVGDATPACWKDAAFRIKPDVLIAPYPYVTTRIGWQTVMGFAPKTMVLVHMPDRESDPDGIWPMAERALETRREIPVQIPMLDETILLT